MKARLTLELESGRCNGSMAIQISDNDRVLKELSDLPQGLLTIPLDIDWPNVLSIHLSGKNKSKDTVLDNQGYILENKFVRLTGLNINGINLHERCLYVICTWIPCDQDAKQEIFWDDNGKVKLEFNEINPLRFMINLDNALYFR